MYFENICACLFLIRTYCLNNVLEIVWLCFPLKVKRNISVQWHGIAMEFSGGDREYWNKLMIFKLLALSLCAQLAFLNKTVCLWITPGLEYQFCKLILPFNHGSTQNRIEIREIKIIKLLKHFTWNFTLQFYIKLVP